MSSPFPGMDPFIEGHEWSNFHTLYIVEIHHALLKMLRPQYVVAVEKHVFLTTESGERQQSIVPDVSIHNRDEDAETTITGTFATHEPVVVTLPELERIEQPYVYIQDADSANIVTIIELLSPANKTGGGRDQYLSKRDQILASGTHHVEVDLLRGGERLPIVGTLPVADYYAFVCRTEDHPQAMLFPFTMRSKLPTIPIPLQGSGQDVPLNLQTVFETTYDNAGYDYILNYDQPIRPQLSAESEKWVGQILKQQKPSESN